ncbi:endonuclease/exonuclease/phosphatase family protein [Mariniblastus fucicola]|uniref:Endonuclease/Exonuclease/phosphatase family protein n=1 Tax=Mariniblastus fucicola TaxID=980251 RepID=A0A5B9PEC2_9BACT|nr:endonuclease/exonuclease/phosphatase family protein [Mariniblastus fucicola]QEG21303.1 Endonuclease/Exonuclease/phosphatase family protein [Mariniblastus fucicola]
MEQNRFRNLLVMLTLACSLSNWADLVGLRPGCCSPVAGTCSAQETDVERPQVLKVLTFNILYGGGEAKSVGFSNEDFGGSRIDEIADVILQSQAEIVCIQEDCGSDALLEALRESNPDWNRYDHVYSTFPILPGSKTDKACGMTVCQVEYAKEKLLSVVNCHWYPSPFGPSLLQDELKLGPPKDLKALAEKIRKKSEKFEGYRGYNATLEAINNAPEGSPVILAGDFNEPSHLDWTVRFSKGGFDRWRKNPGTTKLNFPVAWTGSQLVAKAGLDDAYRSRHPNEVEKPGVTFTPEYAPGTQGRRPIEDQAHTRIDRIYFSPQTLSPIVATVIGEDSEWSDLAYEGNWPSDHRAVLVEFEVQQ